MKKSIPLRTVCEVALLVALEIVLTRLCSFNTLLSKIGPGFVPMALCGMLFGPGWGAAAYALSDFIGATLFPVGPYMPTFTLTAALMGACYGFFLHREELRFFPHMAGAAAVYAIVLSFGLNTAWITLHFGSTYLARLQTRLPQCVILLAAQLVVLPLLTTLRRRLRKAGVAS